MARRSVLDKFFINLTIGPVRLQSEKSDMADRDSTSKFSLSLVQRLWALTGMLLLNLAVLGGLSSIKSGQLLRYLDSVTGVQLPAVRNMTLVDMMHDGLRAVVMDAFFAAESNDQSRLAVLEKELAEKSEDLRLYLAKTATLNLSPSTIEAIRGARPRIDAYVEASDRIMIHARSGRLADAKAALPSFRSRFEELEDQLHQLGVIIEQEAGAIRSDGGDALIIIRWVTGLGLFLGFIFSILVTRSLAHVLAEMTSRIRDAGTTVESTSGKIGGTSQKLSQEASEAAASIEETLSQIHKVLEISKSNSSAASAAEQEATRSRAIADQAELQLRALQDSIAGISAGSKKIGEIVRMIDDIAFQTNLLALNAAVEAARAGEQGRGFAVVAEAVRALAHRSGAAAKDIGEMISGTTQVIDEGRQNTERTARVLGQIVESIKRMAELNVSIARAGEEQAEGISKVTEMMSQLENASRANAATAAELDGCTTGLADQSEQFEQLANELAELVHGPSAA
jgi:methyl-accepting chemotaxis protein